MNTFVCLAVVVLLVAGCAAEDGPVVSATSTTALVDSVVTGSVLVAPSSELGGVPASTVLTVPAADVGDVSAGTVLDSLDPPPLTTTGSGSTGELRWVVVLAAASQSGDPLLDMVQADAQAAGWDAQLSNCQFGAAEALGMTSDLSFTVSVVFESESEASSAVAEIAKLGYSAQLVEVRDICPS